MQQEALAIYGAGYLGQQILHHLQTYRAADTRVLGFIDDTKDAGKAVHNGLLTLGSLEQFQQDQQTQAAVKVVFAIGYTSMRARRAALDRVLATGFELFTFVHPQAIVEPGARIGAGCTILAGAILDQKVQVGAACFVDIGVRLGAGTTVGNNCYLSSGTSTGSRAVLGDDSFFGMDCTITTDVVLGRHVFVNAKTLVARNVADNVKLVELHKSKELPLSSDR